MSAARPPFRFSNERSGFNPPKKALSDLCRHTFPHVTYIEQIYVSLKEKDREVY